jgi:hypothetical protein
MDVREQSGPVELETGSLRTLDAKRREGPSL